MTTRTFKFYGKAFSQTGPVSVTALLGSTQIYSGTVPTIDAVSPGHTGAELSVLFEYAGTTAMTGSMPFELQVANGTVYFGEVTANYSGSAILDPTDPENPVFIPTLPENVWKPISPITADSDGKTNVFVDGTEKFRNIEQYPEALGSWTYEIFENTIFTCDLFIDPDSIVT